MLVLVYKSGCPIIISMQSNGPLKKTDELYGLVLYVLYQSDLWSSLQLGEGAMPDIVDFTEGGKIDEKIWILCMNTNIFF